MSTAFHVGETRYSDPAVRPVRESDAAAVAALFQKNYGSGYLAPDVYDGAWVKRCIYSDAVMGLVIEENGETVASGALMLDLGDGNDRSAELARLVVDPARAGHGIGARLVKALVEAADDSLDYGESHARTAHPLSQHMLEANGFAPIGFLPGYVRGEHLVPYARIFGDAARLRLSPPPRLIPEAVRLAQFALSGLGLDTSVAETHGAPFPADRNYALRTLDSRTIDLLIALRRKPLLIGGFSIDCGMPTLRNRNAACLVACDSLGSVAGSLAFQFDAVSGIAKGIELIGEDPRILGFLCRRFAEIAESDCGASILEVTVDAHEPDIQRTFLDLGFRPAAFAPAAAFLDPCRIDGLRMVKPVHGRLQRQSGPAQLTPKGRLAAEVVLTDQWRTSP